MEPMVSLHHFVEPSWFTKLGGFEKRETVQEHVSRFVNYVTRRLASHYRCWATINEPNLYSACGWLAGDHPPGKTSIRAMLRVFRNLMVAHTLASQAVRDASKSNTQSPIICCPINYALFFPYDPPLPQHLGLLQRMARKVFWTPFHWCITSSVALFMNFATNIVVLDAMLRNGRFPWFPFPFQLLAILGG